MIKIENKYRNRIIESVDMRAGDILENLLNPATHPQTQLNRIAAVLSKFGIVSRLTAYYSERRDGKLTLMNGHARQLLDPDQVWKIDVIDLTDQEIDELVIYYDPLTAMADTDPNIMQGLIDQVKTDDLNLLAMLQEITESDFVFDDSELTDSFADAIRDETDLTTITFTFKTEDAAKIRKLITKSDIITWGNKIARFMLGDENVSDR